jgi:hypothetical protein
MEKLKEIQQKLKAPKDQYNEFAEFDYRNAEDILQAVKPLIGMDAAITTNYHVENVGERYYIVATVTLHDGKQAWSASAPAREPESRKGMDVSQISGAAGSYARKYALAALFAIDNERDADSLDNRKEALKKKPASPKKTTMTTKQRDAIFGSGKKSNLSEDEIKTLVRWKAEKEGVDPKGIKVADFFIGKDDAGEWKMQSVINEYNDYQEKMFKKDETEDIPH